MARAFQVHFVLALAVFVWMAACAGCGTSCNTPRSLSAHLSRCSKYADLASAASANRKRSWKSLPLQTVKKRREGDVRGDSYQEAHSEIMEEDSVHLRVRASYLV